MSEKTFQEKLEQLKQPFPIEDIQWRIITSGEKNGKAWAIVAPYIDNRAIMERLDEVMGAENWKNDLTETSKGAYCGISLRFESEWINKWDGADNTDIEPTKGGVSDSMKRAGVQWGIGRYLYNLPKPLYADIKPDGKHNSKIKGDKWIKWNSPQLPSWALPETPPKTPQEASGGTKGKKEDTSFNDYLRLLVGCQTLDALQKVYEEAYANTEGEQRATIVREKDKKKQVLGRVRK